MRTKILTMILLLIFTVSTTGIVMNKHLCNGDVKNVTAFVKADNCDHPLVEVSDIPSCHEQETQTKEDDCCKTDTQELKVKEQTLAYHKLEMELFAVLTAISNSYATTDITSADNSNSQNYDSPPPLTTKQSLHILYEQYLI